MIRPALTLALAIGAAPAVAQSTPVDYLCGDTVVTASFGEEAAEITVDGTTHALEGRPSASGALYEAPGDAGTSIFTRGTSAIVTVAGERLADCEVAAGDPLQAVTETGLAGDWRVTEISGAAVPDGVAVSLSFEDGHVSGSSGCNAFTGSYVLDGAAFGTGPLASTRKACPPPQSDVETAFFAALAAATTVGQTPEGTLVLAGAETAIRAEQD